MDCVELAHRLQSNSFYANNNNILLSAKDNGLVRSGVTSNAGTQKFGRMPDAEWPAEEQQRHMQDSYHQERDGRQPSRVSANSDSRMSLKERRMIRSKSRERQG